VEQIVFFIRRLAISGDLYPEVVMASVGEVVHTRCCGLDVHKDSVAACVRLTHPGGRVEQEVGTFATNTKGLLELGDWLSSQRVSRVAMESTGVYWKPVWNLLESRCTADGELIELMLVNARHIKNVPGRKTDIKDCQWIAQLLAAGLLSASFVPPRSQRELRDLTRQRVQLLGDRTKVANRLQKFLEDANIKLASVASDVLGASGRDMLRALIDGKMTPAQMADLARMKLRSKIPQLTLALTGSVTDHHRFMLGATLDQVEYLEKQIGLIDQRIEAVMSPLELEAVARLDEIPGFDKRAAQNVIAEIGTDMNRFPSEPHLASWAGLCPGNNESAGKRKSGHMTEGNKWLKRTLNQTAWAGSRAKTSYFRAQFQRLSHRRGAKRAAMAVAHSQLGTVYQLLRHGKAFVDLGVDYFEKANIESVKNRLIQKLKRLGCKVTVESAAA
jgi:transposase